MSLDADAIADRRRLKRRLSLWRLAAVVAVVAGVLAALAASDRKGLFGGRSHIAAVDVGGLITGDQDQLELLRELGESSGAKAVIVRIDSPGGTTAGSEMLYEEIRKLAAKKPVVALMETVAASGGYIAALAADHIVARGNTITGSIGVIFQWADVQEALASLGVDVQEIKSGPLKAEPSMFSETSDAARIVAAQMVRDGHEWFVGLVAERRPFDLSTARSLSDGRVYTGRQAVAARLVDRIGGETEAREWLQTERGLDSGLDIVEWSEDDVSEGNVGLRILVLLARTLGFGDLGEEILSVSAMARTPRLDGLLSLWHPQLLK